MSESGEPAEPDVVELDHRKSGTFDVSLFWNRRAGHVILQVVAWNDDEDDFSRVVDPAAALEAFRHPFLHAPRTAAPIAEPERAAEWC